MFQHHPTAAEAARALREAADKPKCSFAEASKVVKCPEFFGYATADEDQNNWRDSAFSFKAWLTVADAEFDRELGIIEKASQTPIALPIEPGTLQGAYKLYAILSGLLRHRPFRIHRHVVDRNGFETWRQLCQLFEPRAKSRSISLLQALMSFPNFDKTRTLLEQIQSLERIREEYQRTSGTCLSDDIMTSTLLPKHIQQHLHLQMTSTSDYASVRQMVLSYEVASSTHSTGRTHAELGVVTSYAAPTGSGPQPMEIDQIAQSGKFGKGKSKSKDGKGKPGKGKGKGKSTKGKNQYDGKQGKGKGNDKGSHDGKGKKIDSNQCSYCMKLGHWRRDCNKLKEDQKHNRVRQIEEVDTGSQSSNATTTTGPTTSTVRLVSISPVIHEHSSEQVVSQFIRVLSMGMLTPKLPDHCMSQNLSTFDLAYSDDNEDWIHATHLLGVSPVVMNICHRFESWWMHQLQLRSSWIQELMLAHYPGAMAMLELRWDSVKLSSLMLKVHHYRYTQQELQR